MEGRRLVVRTLAVLQAFWMIAPAAASSADAEPDSSVSIAAADSSGGWSANVILTTADVGRSNQVEPSIDIDSQGRVSVAFKLADSPSGGGAGIGFTYSGDAGTTWAAAKSLTSGASDAWLTHDGDDTFILATLESGISARRSTDGGVTWGTKVKANPGGGSSDKESIACDLNGTVYMVYDDKGASRTKGSVSKDGGKTWANVVDVADRTESSVGAGYVLADRKRGGAVAAFYVNNDIWFDRTADGLSWGTDVRVNDQPGTADGSGLGQYKFGSIPAVAIAPSGEVYVVWWDKREGRLDIYGSRSDDGGATWSPNFRVNEKDSGKDQWMPAIVADSKGVIHVAWYDERYGAYNVMYSNSTDKGSTWSASVNITDATTPLSFTRPGDYFALAVGPDDSLYAAWTDGRSGPDLEIAFSKKAAAPGPVNNAPLTPTISGPNMTQDTAQPLTLNFTSTDPDADNLSYIVDWGDGKTSQSSWNASGAKARLAHTWVLVGTYQVRAKARDDGGKESAWSSPHQVTVYQQGGKNSPPNAPAIDGPSSVCMGHPIPLNFSAIDPDVDSVIIEVNWGDGTNSSLGPAQSGADVEAKHTYANSTTSADIIARATDTKGATGPWSAAHRLGFIADCEPRPIPPLIDHVPVATAPQGKPLTIVANVSDDGTVVEVALRYRPTGGHWISASMSTGGAGRWSGAIPASATQGDSVDYYIEAKDDAGLDAHHPRQNPESKPHHVTLITDQPAPSPCPLGSCILGAPLLLALPIVLLVVVLAAIVVAVLMRRRRRSREIPAAAPDFSGQTPHHR